MQKVVLRCGSKIPTHTVTHTPKRPERTKEHRTGRSAFPSGFLLPFTKHLDDVPFESTVEISADSVVSPLYLTELSSVAVTKLRVCAMHGKDVLAEQSCEVTVLPFDYWSGRGGNAELFLKQAEEFRPAIVLSGGCCCGPSANRRV